MLLVKVFRFSCTVIANPNVNFILFSKAVNIPLTRDFKKWDFSGRNCEAWHKLNEHVSVELPHFGIDDRQRGFSIARLTLCKLPCVALSYDDTFHLRTLLSFFLCLVPRSPTKTAAELLTHATTARDVRKRQEVLS